MNRAHVSTGLGFVWVLCLGLGAAVWAQPAPTDPNTDPNTGYLHQLRYANGAVALQQVTFQLAGGIVSDTDWGQVQVDPNRWGHSTGLTHGYLNIFIYSETDRLTPIWWVENLCLPRRLVSDCDGSETEPQPLSTYVDLRPTEEGSGRLTAIRGVMLVSEQPLPRIERILVAASEFVAEVMDVSPVVINAEGDYGPMGTAPTMPTTRLQPLLVGLPPLPPDPPGPDFPQNLAFAQEVFQNDQPNIQAAWNQCVPMAHANVLRYLQNRYNGIPLVWKVPHAPVPGIGREMQTGNGPVWTADPFNSLVGQIDAFTRREGVTSAAVGEGTDRCQQIRGIFGYLGMYGDSAQVVYRHQGGDEFYGEGHSCDDPVGFNGLVSQREGIYPTWQWMFDQLSQGRGLAMSFGRYAPNGDRTSGHMLRVWGAAQYNNKKYLFTLDDGSQGINNTGLETQQWEVADTGGPGMPGVPDGQLNLDDTSWEIEFAISAEAIPTLSLP